MAEKITRKEREIFTEALRAAYSVMRKHGLSWTDMLRCFEYMLDAYLKMVKRTAKDAGIDLDTASHDGKA